MPLYAQGHSLAQWLIESRGRKAFLEFLADGMQDENWPRAVHQHYGFDNLLAMQNVVDRLGEARPAAADAGNVADRPAGVATRSDRRRDDARRRRRSVAMQSPDDITPIARPSTPASSGRAAPVTVASASGSVYARSGRAGRARAAAASVARDGRCVSGIRARASYDASRGRGTWRRCIADAQRRCDRVAGYSAMPNSCRVTW